ncbi:MAG TPA: hypothetical protein VH183_04405 [Burkholderiaceae bacterium]|nr:hypothetical protein [Burkholderiaceae bacterium]
MIKKALATAVAVFGAASGAFAQHASDNPVVSADDGFGLTIGNESTGIYNPGMVRGFSPQTAGNVRINGLYFDQQGALSNRVVEGSTIRVGISAIGYAFPAPTGIVDYDLRHATDGQPTATVIADAGPFATRGISVDGSLPLISKQLQLPMGASYQIGGPANGANAGYKSTVVNFAAAPQWAPNDRLTVRAFVDWQQTSHAQTSPVVFTAGDFLPPRIARRNLGQDWAEGDFINRNYGGTLNAKITQRWSLAAGVFRSEADNPVSYADLYVNTQPSGLADHVVVGNPDQRSASNSGEARLTGHFADGQRSNDVVLLVRGRDAVARYGGSDVIDAGPALIGQGVQVPQPTFVYTARTYDHTRLWSAGAAYQAQWAAEGEVAFGAQKEDYEKTVLAPGDPPARLTSSPWRFYGSALKILTDRVTAYAGYTQGFEDSGVAPNSAQNRGTILPTSRTWQADGGIRYRLSPKLNLIAGLFEINKPYFNFDTGNVDRELGQQRAKGVEISLAGQLAQGLSVNAGGVVGLVAVVGPNLAAEGIGKAAFGQPRNQFLVNFDYALPKLPALSFDVGVYHFGAAPASVNGAVDDPQVTQLNLGTRYKFGLFGAPSSVRLQVQNVTDAYLWNIGFNPGYVQFAPRTYVGYLTVDL